jgi:hypothetical protein
MELQEAVLAYRAHVADFFSKADPRPTDDWIAKKVDQLIPLETAETLTDAPPFTKQEQVA